MCPLCLSFNYVNSEICDLCGVNMKKTKFHNKERSENFLLHLQMRSLKENYLENLLNVISINYIKALVLLCDRLCLEREVYFIMLLYYLYLFSIVLHPV